MASLREDLTRIVGPCRETHISWVFVGERLVFKVKKPVSLGFLDFSTPEKRRGACEAEVHLNRRWSPDVYEGVVPIVRDARGEHLLAGPGPVVDWAVKMKRLPDDDRGDALLAAGRLGPREARQLAEVLAAFHARASSDRHVRAFGRLEVLRRHTAENLRQSRRHPVPGGPPSLLREVARFQGRFLRDNAALFEERRKKGFVRDGHGDLRLDQLYIHGGTVAALDCIEFDEQYRCVDTAADAAFLSMDFRKHGRPDLAEIFLATYVRASGDHALYRLISFYESQRAQVRALVAGVLSDDRTVSQESREAARAEVVRCLTLARELGNTLNRRGALVAVGGEIGSGKSALSEALAERWGVPEFNSDRLRKRLEGVAVTAPLKAGAYSEAAHRRVYAGLFEAARSVLMSGRSVVLDATFRSRSFRREARTLAADLGASFLFLECRAGEDVCRARLLAREGKNNVSDARAPIWDVLHAQWEPVSEFSPAEHHVIDTSGPVEEALAQADRFRPPGLPPA